MNQDDYVQPMIEITQEEYGSLLQTETRMQMINDYIDMKDMESAILYGSHEDLINSTFRLLAGHKDKKELETAINNYKSKKEAKGAQNTL